MDDARLWSNIACGVSRLMEWTELKALFYEVTGDDAVDPEWFAETTILAWANEAIRDFVRDSRCLESRAAMMVTADTHTYDFPDDCESIFRVTYDGERIGYITKQRLRNYDERWREKSGTPRFYILNELNEQLELYENPSVSTTVETFSYTGSARYGAIVDASGSARPSGTPYGVVVDATDATPPGIDVPGAVVDAIKMGSGGYALEIFYHARPAGATRDTSINIPHWAKHGILWGMLARAYSADTLVQSKEAASAYWHLYNHLKRRLRVQSMNKIDRVWVMGSSKSQGKRTIVSRLPEHIPEPT